jgi:hypothetical protein
MGAWPTIPQSRQVKVASSFEHLRDFIRKRMRMSHIYQPVMIKELLTSGGKSSIRNIAAAFLARDASQLEYYEQITKDMPGKVLAKHGIVERDGPDYRLSTDPSSLSSEERDELTRLCDEAISTYLQKRGTAVYDHRRAALGYLSGSLRYEVLKRAGFRCELCGISADERAIEVDHILPRKHGGQDDHTNLQALCFKCNANKGARDDEDFRPLHSAVCNLLRTLSVWWPAKWASGSSEIRGRIRIGTSQAGREQILRVRPTRSCRRHMQCTPEHRAFQYRIGLSDRMKGSCIW